MAANREKNYLFANARIHAMENALLSRDKYERLLEAQDTDAFLRALGEIGYKKITSAAEAEPLFEAELLQAYRDVSEMLPDTAVFRAMRFPYDCHNIKLAIKCEKRPSFSYEELSSPLSFVAPQDILRAVASRDTQGLPACMAAAVPEAISAFDKTTDPQYIDLILDAACYADMERIAKESNSPEFTEYLCIRADTVNILSCLRIMRMKKDYAFFSLSFVSGGKLPLSFFSAMEEGEEAFAGALSGTEYSFAVADSSLTMQTVYERMDAFLQTKLAEMAPSAFSAGAAIGYLCKCEAQVRNLRILIAAKQAGESTQQTRARLTV